MTRGVAPARSGRVVRAAALAVALLLVITQTAVGVTWHDRVQVDYLIDTNSTKSLAVTGTQRVHVFYGYAGEAVCRRSGDGGLTWSGPYPIQLSPDGQTSTDPLAIKRFGLSTLDVIWINNTGGEQSLWYRRSLNNGFAWDEPMHVAPGQVVANSDVARFGDRVSIVYTNALTGSIDVIMSTDGGASFGDPVSVGTTVDGDPPFDTGGYPAIVDKNGTITVAWFTHHLFSDRELVIRRSTNAGATWRPVQVLKGIDSGVVMAPISLLGAGPLKIIVGYKTYDGEHRAAARTSLNAGKTWRPEVRVGGADSEAPIFAYGGGLLRAAYASCHPFSPGCDLLQIKFKTSEDFGASWSPSAIVDEGARFGAARGIGALVTGQSVVLFHGTTYNYLWSRTTLE